MLPTDWITRLDVARIARIMNLLQQLEDELDFVTKLTPDDRQSVNGVDQGRLPFVELTEEYSAEYTEVLEISTASRDKIARNNFDFRALRAILTKLQSLTEGVSDTTLLIGGICYDEGLIVKTLVEVAMRRKKPGVEVLWDNLMKLFERHGRRGKDNEGEDGNGGDGNGGPNITT